MSERILAVVVCYNPDLGALGRALTAAATQGCTILVVDNASANIRGIRELCASDQHTALIELQRNCGLGAAHNKGISYAQDNDFSQVLLLDQDSIPLDGMVSALQSALAVKSSKGLVSAVGATYLNADNGSESFFVRFGRFKFHRRYCGARDEDGCVQADFLISSGSLINLAHIEAIGLMDETLFIDHVDTEWFLCAKGRGFNAYGVCDAVMQHGLGESTHRVSLGGRQRNVPQHKPFRYYYIFRNSVLLYKRGYASALWKWNDIQRLAMIVIMFGLLKAPRLVNLKMMLKGVWHGLRGKTGPMDA
ncbi:MAG: rhamnosyltransferase [Cryomorphaceae bacterium]|jgi:rhamnosyltransferase